MPALRNGRHERFCQEITGGKSLGRAYQSAGYRGDRHAAAKLRQKHHISQRIEELLAERALVDKESHAAAVREAGVDKIQVLNQFSRLAFADMGDYADWGPEGVTIRAKSELTPEQRQAIQEITESQHADEDGNVTRHLKLKLVDKVAPLRDLGRHLHLFDPRSDRMTEEQARAFVRNLLGILRRHVAPEVLDAVIEEVRESRKGAIA